MTEFSLSQNTMTEQSQTSSQLIASYVPYYKSYFLQNDHSYRTPLNNVVSSAFSKDSSNSGNLINQHTRHRSISVPGDVIPQLLHNPYFENHTSSKQQNELSFSGKHLHELSQKEEKKIELPPQSTLGLSHNQPSYSTLNRHYDYQQITPNIQQTHIHLIQLPALSFQPIILPKQRIFNYQKERDQQSPETKDFLMPSKSPQQQQKVIKSILKKCSIINNFNLVLESIGIIHEKNDQQPDLSLLSQNSSHHVLKDSICLQQNHHSHANKVEDLQLLLEQKSTTFFKTRQLNERKKSLQDSKRVRFSPKNTFSILDSSTTTDSSDSESLQQPNQEEYFLESNDTTQQQLVSSTNSNNQRTLDFQPTQINNIPISNIHLPSNIVEITPLESQSQQSVTTPSKTLNVSPLLALFKDQDISLRRSKIYFKPQQQKESEISFLQNNNQKTTNKSES